MRRVPITKARQALNRKGFKGTALAYPAPVMQRYSKRLGAMVAQMVAQTEREIKAWIKTHAPAGTAMDASPASQARIVTNDLMRRFGAMFAKHAPEYARDMVTQTASASSTALHASLKQMSGGLSLKTSQITPAMREMFKASIQENVSLIKTISTEYHDKVQRAVMQSITKDGGMETLIPKLEEIGAYAHRKAELVALDQTRKVFGNANRSRMSSLGVKKFTWIHSGGGSHPREQHMDWDGEIFSFDDLPVDDSTGEPVIPGQAHNCKCTMAPYFEFEEDE